MVTSDAAERFHKAPWLSDLDDSSRRALLDVLREERAEAGAVLLEPGRPNHRVLFLLEGSVGVTRDYPGHGEEDVVSLSAPTAFGTTSFVRDSPPVTRVHAEGPVWYLVLDRESHRILRRDNPKAAEQFAMATLKVVAERFDLLDRKLADFFHRQEEGSPARADEWSAFRARLFEESGD